MLNRRLLMAQAGAKPPSEWDIDWEKADGSLEDFGWSVTGSPVYAPEIGETIAIGDAFELTIQNPVKTMELDYTVLEYSPFDSSGLTAEVHFAPDGIGYCAMSYQEYKGLTGNWTRISFGNSPAVGEPHTLKIVWGKSASIEIDGRVKWSGATLKSGLKSIKIFQHKGGKTVLHGIRVKLGGVIPE